MIEDLFKKRRQIRAAWDRDRIPSKELIHDLITRAFNIAPSKQNLFPFKIHVIEPDNDEDHFNISKICALFKTGSVNNWEMDDEQAYETLKATNRKPPWVLVFELRKSEPNEFVKQHSARHNDNYRFLQVMDTYYRRFPNTMLAAIEVGMFVKCLGGLCLENNLAMSYIKSYPEWILGKDDEWIKDMNPVGNNWDTLPQITEVPILIVQIGYKAEIDDSLASNSVNPEQPYWENKPDIESLVEYHPKKS